MTKTASLLCYASLVLPFNGMLLYKCIVYMCNINIRLVHKDRTQKSESEVSESLVKVHTVLERHPSAYPCCPFLPKAV